MVENLFSVVLFFSIGYLLRKVRVFTEKDADVLIKFIIYVSFPALVVYNIYHLQLSSSVFWIVVSGWTVIIFSIILSFLAGRLLNLPRPTLASFVMMSSFGNTSFLGFPFQLALLGEKGLRYAVIFDQLASFLPVSLLSPFILSYGQGKNPRLDIKKVITFPPFIAVVFSFLIKGFPVPEFVLGSLKTIGMTVIPLALFSVGVNLRFSKVKERLRDVSAVILIKMVVVPAVFIGFILFAGISMDIPYLSAVIEISMPPMVLASILVIGAGLDRDLAVSSVGTGIIFSFLSVPALFFMVRLLTA